MKAGFAKGNALLVGGAVAAVAVAAGLYVSGVFGPVGRGLPEGRITAPQPVAQAPVESPADSPADQQLAAPQPESVDVPDADTAGTAPETPPEDATPPAPSFDVVRVEPDGTAVIAGRAAPSATVAILLDRVELTQARADAEGRFVSFLTLPRSDRARVLTLAADGRPGDAEVILAPTPVAQPQTGPAIAAAPGADSPAAADPTAGAPVVAALDPEDAPAVEEGTGAAPVADETAAPESAAPESGESAPDQASPPPASPSAPDDAAPAAPAGVVAQDSAPAPMPADSVPAETADAASDPAEAPPADEEDAAPEIAALDPADAPASGDTADGPPTATQTSPPPDQDIASGEAPSTSMSTSTSTAPDAADGAPETATAPTVLLSDADGVRVLQAPASAAPEVMSSVALDAISYSETGAVELAGRAPEGGFVRVYLDNAPITSSRIEAGGNWRTALPEIDEGVYTLRIDQVDTEGQVTSRIETPFKREAPAQLAAADSGADAPVRSITVQPGNTLWAIARDTYGEGVLYLRVFEANRSQIRDPDLIYPGQVFALPE